MATGDSKSKAPSFYENAAAMSMPGAGGAPKAAGGDKGDKNKSVAALLEIVQKLDSMEQDPELKKLTQQIVSTTQQYMDKVQGGGAKPPAEGAVPPPPPMEGGAPGAGAPAGGPGAGSPMPA